jgi:hypothetical protein
MYSNLLGVTKEKGNRTKPWKAHITINNQYKFIGMFATQEEAHEAYIKIKRCCHEGCTI